MGAPLTYQECSCEYIATILHILCEQCSSLQFLHRKYIANISQIYRKYIVNIAAMACPGNSTCHIFASNLDCYNILISVRKMIAGRLCLFH